jgi:hypothetical protein
MAEQMFDFVKRCWVQAEELVGQTSSVDELNILDGVTATAAEINILDGVTATYAELNYNDITTAGAAQATKSVVLDANKDHAGIRNLTLGTNGATGAAVGTLVLRDGQNPGYAATLETDSQTANLTVHIPDPGAMVDSYVAMSTAALTAAEVDVLDAVTPGTLASSKAVVLNSVGSIANDSILTLGTTVATAATKLTLEFDATTTGIGQICIGTESVAQVLGASAAGTIQAVAINLLHDDTTGEGIDNLEGIKSRVSMQGAGDAGVTMIGGTFRSYVLAGVAGEVYGIQPWAKHVGTGTVTAMSGLSAALLINDAEAFTATNSINAGHFHVKTVSGAANGAVTCANFDGVMIEVYPNVTGLDSALHIVNESSAAVTNGINLAGIFTSGIVMTGTLGQALQIGVKSSTVGVNMALHTANGDGSGIARMIGVFCDDGGSLANGIDINAIESRYLVGTDLSATVGSSIKASRGHLRVATGKLPAASECAGLSGYLEIDGTSVIGTGINAAISATVDASGTVTGAANSILSGVSVSSGNGITLGTARSTIFDLRYAPSFQSLVELVGTASCYTASGLSGSVSAAGLKVVIDNTTYILRLYPNN